MSNFMSMLEHVKVELDTLLELTNDSFNNHLKKFGVELANLIQA